MKKLLSLFALATVLVIAPTGCGTLDQNGPYQANKVLYDADLAISSGYDLMQTFVLWEYQNRKSVPLEVTKAADNVRKNARSWILTAIALRDSYKVNPSDANKEALQQAISTITTALAEATKYMAMNSQPSN